MRSIKKTSADQTFLVYAVDDVTGQPKTGLAYSGVTARYVRTRGAATAITMAALGSATAAHVDGGWYEIDATNCRGWYRFDAPDAAFAAGGDGVLIVLQAAGALLGPVAAAMVDHTPDDLYPDVHLARAMLANKRIHTISTGVDVVKDDDGTTTLRTMTPSDGGDDTIVVNPS